MMVPIQVIRWYRMQCYDGTDSCAIVVPIRRYCHLIYKDFGLSYHDIFDIAMKYDKCIIGFIDLSLSPDIRTLELQDQKSMGYTLRCLSAALLAYWHARSFEDGLLAIVRAGGDADTNAAVACAILGARFGVYEK